MTEHANLFPLTSRYDQSWVVGNSMGPNVLWLAESLSPFLNIRPGMRVLDLGCGKAISSIFLAKEFDVQVWAADLWIKPSENWSRIVEAGAQDRVFPINVEAHDLPFADGFFDLIVSLDAYHYFGTNDLYLEYLLRFLKPGGQIGIVVPGFKRELASLKEVPSNLFDIFTKDGFHSFHTPDWWRFHWEKTALVNVDCADEAPESATIWRAYADVNAYGDGHVIQADAGALLTFTRVIATKL